MLERVYVENVVKEAQLDRLVKMDRQENLDQRVKRDKKVMLVSNQEVSKLSFIMIRDND